MPSIFMRACVRWQERFNAKPGESRGHAEMRSNRNYRKHMRKVRRAANA